MGRNNPILESKYATSLIINYICRYLNVVDYIKNKVRFQMNFTYNVKYLNFRIITLAHILSNHYFYSKIA